MRGYTVANENGPGMEAPRDMEPGRATIPDILNLLAEHGRDLRNVRERLKTILGSLLTEPTPPAANERGGEVRPSAPGQLGRIACHLEDNADLVRQIKRALSDVESYVLTPTDQKEWRREDVPMPGAPFRSGGQAP